MSDNSQDFPQPVQEVSLEPGNETRSESENPTEEGNGAKDNNSVGQENDSEVVQEASEESNIETQPEIIDPIGDKNDTEDKIPVEQKNEIKSDEGVSVERNIDTQPDSKNATENESSAQDNQTVEEQNDIKPGVDPPVASEIVIRAEKEDLVIDSENSTQDNKHAELEDNVKPDQADCSESNNGNRLETRNTLEDEDKTQDNILSSPENECLEPNEETKPPSGNPFEDDRITQDERPVQQGDDYTGKNPFSCSEDNSPVPNPVVQITSKYHPVGAHYSSEPILNQQGTSTDVDQLHFRGNLSDNFQGKANDRDWATFKEQPGDMVVEHLRPNISTTRVWISVLIVMGTAMLGFTGSSANRTQYLTYRIGRDRYNYTGETDEIASDGTTDGETYDVMNAIEAEVSLIIIYLTLATGIPSVILSLFIGSYSDFLGRRPLLTIAVFGLFIKAFSLAAVSYFDISIAYLYLGGFLEGLTGSIYCVILSTTSLVADITPVLTSRATRFAILQGTLFISSAVSQFAVGYMIADWGYAVPAWVATGLEVFAMFVIAVALPETHESNRTEKINWNPVFHLKKVLGFYFGKSHGQRRALYIIGLIIYLLVDLIICGRFSVEILYFLKDPINWNSVEIGIYEAFRQIVWSVVAMVVLRLVRVRYPLEATGIAAALSLCAGLILQAFAQAGYWLYISAVASILSGITLPVPKALLSRITSPSEQGALFSGLAFVDAVADMTSSVFCSFVYQQTLNSFSGAVFMLLAGFAFLITLFNGVYWLIRRHLPAVVIGEANFRARFKGETPPKLPQSLLSHSKGDHPPRPPVDREDLNERTPLLA